jgi:hypothetical protein
MELLFADINPGAEATIGHSQYMDIALIKNY